MVLCFDERAVSGCYLENTFSLLENCLISVVLISIASEKSLSRPVALEIRIQG